VAQSERNAGRGIGGLTTAEREELNRLRHESRQLRVEREIFSKAAAWSMRHAVEGAIQLVPGRGEAPRPTVREVEVATARFEPESPAFTKHVMEAICDPDDIEAALRTVVRVPQASTG
jgi:hypothetical protein